MQNIPIIDLGSGEDIIERDNIYSKNICIFTEGEVGRSPTGSGVSGRMDLYCDKI
jgi:trans-L-3-hydroxyproline dehydratase